MKKLLVLGMAALLTACGGAGVKSVKDESALKTSYLGRYMAEPAIRRSIDAKMRSSNDYALWGGPKASTYLDMGTALATESMNLGHTVGNAVFFAGVLLGDGSMDYISQATIAVDEGINTQDEANKFILNRITSQVEKLGATIGTGAECVMGCDSAQRLYRLPVTNEYVKSTYEDAYSNVWVSVDIKGAQAVSPEDPLHVALGYNVAWATPEGDSASVRFYGQKAGKRSPVIERNDQGAPVPKITTETISLTRQDFGRLLISTMATEKGLIWGTQKGHPSILIVDGKQYRFSSNSYYDFIKRSIPSPERISVK